MDTRVEVYSRQDCHLCNEALAVVSQVCDEAGEGFQVIDIDARPELRAKYSDDVPVVLVDGEVVGFWRIRPELLRVALARGAAT